MDAVHIPAWPRIGLGCATLGTPAPLLGDAAAEAVMRAAIDHGIRLFDVAPLYGGGVAEERLGRVLKRLPRDQYVLCTKTGVTRPYAQTAQPPGAARRRAFDHWDYSAAATRASVAASLARLQVARLDVVHLHDVDLHVDECLAARDELAVMQREGIVGAIGIGSNLVEPVATLLGRARFDTFLLAGCYTLLDQRGSALFVQAQSQGVRVIAGGVFNSGVLAKWPNPDATFGYVPAGEDVRARTARIAAVCARHGVPLGVAALQFVLANSAITSVLIGPRTVAELEANLAALHTTVPDALWDALVHEGLVAAGVRSPRDATPAPGRAVSA
ncbi:MAG TPA: aldo/keto reductase [Casimicrobiaceae bacterium]